MSLGSLRCCSGHSLCRGCCRATPQADTSERKAHLQEDAENINPPVGPRDVAEQSLTKSLGLLQSDNALDLHFADGLESEFGVVRAKKAAADQEEEGKKDEVTHGQRMSDTARRVSMSFR